MVNNHGWMGSAASGAEFWKRKKRRRVYCLYINAWRSPRLLLDKNNCQADWSAYTWRMAGDLCKVRNSNRPLEDSRYNPRYQRCCPHKCTKNDRRYSLPSKAEAKLLAENQQLMPIKASSSKTSPLAQRSTLQRHQKKSESVLFGP